MPRYDEVVRVLTWNGRSIPAELRKLPPGKYAVEPLDRMPRLTKEQEAGIDAALSSLEAGRGMPARRATAGLRSMVRKAARDGAGERPLLAGGARRSTKCADVPWRQES